MTRRLLLNTAALCLALAAGAAHAGDDSRAAQREQWCKDNPAKCEEVKARHEAFCKENPQTCEERKAAREKRKAECEANPAACRKMKDERKARHEKMKAACKDNPKECEKRRKEMRERRKDRSDKFCAEHPDKCDGEPDEDEE